MFQLVSTALAFVVIFSSAAMGQNVPSGGDRFALYNLCAPLGLVIESLSEDAAAAGLTATQLKALAESRLRAVGLHQSDALTFLRVAASRYVVQLRYMKPVIDVASSETETIQTYSKSAAVRDGTAAGIMLEVSKLLDLFLIEYQRVNEPECAETNPPRSNAPQRTVTPSPSEAEERAGPSGHTGPDPRFGDDGSKVNRIGGGVTSPRLIRKVEPSYTEKARNAKLEGNVLLSIEVWEDGKAHNIRVIRSVGMGLDEKAVEAVSQWIFEPGKKNGQPVKVAAQIQVSFRLLVDPQDR